MGALMSVELLLLETVNRGNTPFTEDGSAEYYKSLHRLLDVISPGTANFDEVYNDVGLIIGFDIDGIRITLREA